MNLLPIMAAVPGPDVRCSQHRGCPIIAEPLIQSGLAVVLSVLGTQGVRPEVSRVPGEVVTILVIKNARVVRRVRPVPAARSLHQRSRLYHSPPSAPITLPLPSVLLAS